MRLKRFSIIILPHSSWFFFVTLCSSIIKVHCYLQRRRRFFFLHWSKLFNHSLIIIIIISGFHREYLNLKKMYTNIELEKNFFARTLLVIYSNSYINISVIVASTLTAQIMNKNICANVRSMRVVESFLCVRVVPL